jgi:phosphatidyl-myo-inositol dimannoside synthase
VRRGRILFLTSNFPRWRGDSTTPFVLHLAEDLQELGWAVDVVAPHAEGAAADEVLEGLQVHRFRYLWPPSLQTVCYQGGALINLREDRWNYAKLPFLVGAEWLVATRRMVSGRYDLLHSHWILPQGLLGTLSARPLRIPHVVTVHGGDIFALQTPVLRALKRFTLHHANAVTVNSSATHKAVRELAPHARHLVSIPMGVTANGTPQPASIAEVRKRYRRGDGPLLLFVGRLVEEKGVEDVIRALGLISPTLPDATAVIVGEGQHRTMFERLAHELHLEQRVAFTGWVDAALVPSYMAASDIFVAPSRRSPEGWMEAQGLTLIEAMRAARPVIATRLGGVVDVVAHEETGLLVRERAPADLAEAIERLVRSEGLALRLGEKGQEQVSSRFSRTAAAQAFSDLFASLVVRDRRRRAS